MEQLTQQQKLEILCAYLPYGVECNVDGKIATMHSVYSDGSCTFYDLIESDKGFESVRPILRHPDDMTEEENAHKMKLWGETSGMLDTAIIVLRYLHSIHIDTFGAIEAGWAVRKK